MKFHCLTFLFVNLLISASAAPVDAQSIYRSYDGSGNNLLHPTWGAAGTPLARKGPVGYQDGISLPRGTVDMGFPQTSALPNPRTVSNLVVKQTVMTPNSSNLTDWVFQWGQFVDHDLSLSLAEEPIEEFDVSMPMGDDPFDMGSTGTKLMEFQRSKFDPTSGTSVANPRQQINELTSYLDASQVYGSDATRALALRTMSGGKLKSSPGNLLPLNTMNLPNATGGPLPADQFYVAGDVRANEQVGLTTVHTLFMREHNRLADQIAPTITGLTDAEKDEVVYQTARKLVGGEIQAITFKEFLPALLGSSAPSISSTYDQNLNAAVLNEFSAALYRVGHTMLPPNLPRMQNDGAEAPGGGMGLRDAFFLMQNMAATDEVDFFAKGLASERQQQIDIHVVDDVRNFLFGDPIPGGFDLPTLNIQRGRDHGLPDYNTVRVAFGLAPKATFEDITSDPQVQASLAAAYGGDVNKIDPWVGALSEDHYGDAAAGELIVTALAEQFRRTRDGDRFWFLNDAGLSSADKAWLMSRRLSDVIRDNTSITNLQGNVFLMPVPEPCAALIAALALAPAAAWRRKHSPA